MVEGEWEIGLNLRKSAEGTADRIARIADLPIDYTLPNVCPYGQEEYHAFNEHTRRAFDETLRRVAGVSKSGRSKRAA